MSQKINKPFCTMFKRTETEKRVWQAAKELEQQRLEIEELKKQLAELRGEDIDESVTTSKSRKKKTT